MPMPSCDELGEAHTDPPPWTGSPWPPGSRIRPGPSRCRPGPMGGKRHLTAVWDMVLESRGMHGTFRISFPCLIVVRGVPTCPRGRSWWACLPTGL